MIRLAMLVFGLAVVSGVSPHHGRIAHPAQDGAPDSLALLQKARAAATDMLQSTRQVLMRHLASGGPAVAIAACADSAPLIGRTVAAKHGLQIRRVSDRWRNAGNIPDPYEKEVLRAFDALMKEGRLSDQTEHFAIIRTGDRPVARYSKPIVVQGPCLSCHGTTQSILPAVRDLLRSRYPDDHATGYAAGQLRGAVSVTIPVGDPEGRPD
jgi:hypothetical protein